MVCSDNPAVSRQMRPSPRLTRYRSRLPSRSEMKRMLLPSGIHTRLVLSDVASVTRCGGLPDADTIQIELGAMFPIAFAA